MDKRFYVYIMTNRSRTLYTGVTSDLVRRVQEHVEGFTSRYKLDRLVYYDSADNPHSAIAREKQIKGWTRNKKIALIESSNPTWQDLAEPWLGKPDSSLRSE